MNRYCLVCHGLVPSARWLQHKHRHARPPEVRAQHDAIRLQALNRDGRRCTVCRRTYIQVLTETGVGLEMHHLNGDPTDNRLANVEMRCVDHHPRGPSKEHQVDG